VTSLVSGADEDDAAEAGHTKPSLPDSAVTEDTKGSFCNGSEESSSKRVKLSGAQKKRLARSDARSAKGMNKNRLFMHVSDKIEICWRFVSGETCPGKPRYFSSVMTLKVCTNLTVSVPAADSLTILVHTSIANRPTFSGPLSLRHSQHLRLSFLNTPLRHLALDPQLMLKRVARYSCALDIVDMGSSAASLVAM